MGSIEGQAVDIAVIGCGYIAVAEHIPSILTSRNARLRAAVEPRADMRAAIAARFGIPVHASVADMVAAGTSVRAAVICSGPLSHAALIEEAFAAGYDVLVENPYVTASRRDRGSSRRPQGPAASSWSATCAATTTTCSKRAG